MNSRFSPPDHTWSEAHIKKMNAVYCQIFSALKTPHHAIAARKIISHYLSRENFGGSSKKTIRDQINDNLNTVDLRWNPASKRFRKILSTSDNVAPVEIAIAFFDKGYFCYGTALYWNNLTNQVPTNFYIAQERVAPSPRRDVQEIDEFEMMDNSIKPPRETRKVASYGEYKFTLIERDYTDFIGVTEKITTHSGRKIRFRCTNLERTLLDCAIHPHRAGGLQALISAFDEGSRRLSIAKMAAYYHSLNLYYPYWQRIGLILKNTCTVIKTSEWKKQFGPPRSRFFIDKLYRSTWVIDSEWNVAYPQGLF